MLAGGYSPEQDAQAWGRLADLAALSKLDTPVGRVWSFDEVPEMVAQQTTPPPGKSVVRVA